MKKCFFLYFEILREERFMGQYGEIKKIVLNQQVFIVSNIEQHSVYITFESEKEAALAIMAL